MEQKVHIIEGSSAWELGRLFRFTDDRWRQLVVASRARTKTQTAAVTNQKSRNIHMNMINAALNNSMCVTKVIGTR